jgi:hypothetical protein
MLRRLSTPRFGVLGERATLPDRGSPDAVLANLRRLEKERDLVLRVANELKT